MYASRYVGYEWHAGYEKLRSSLASGNLHAQQMRKNRVQTPRFVGELMQGEIEVFANEKLVSESPSTIRLRFGDCGVKIDELSVWRPWLGRPHTKTVMWRMWTYANASKGLESLGESWTFGYYGHYGHHGKVHTYISGWEGMVWCLELCYPSLFPDHLINPDISLQ